MKNLIKKIARPILSYFNLFGIDPLKAISSFRGLPFYLNDLRILKIQQKSSKKNFAFGRFVPYLYERFEESGTANGAYFHQDLLVARRIFINNPHKHVDVGSRVDGFVAHVAAYRSIEVIDIRELSNTVKNIQFVQADMMAPLRNELIGYCDSLSCLHALEHFGLGRYGDPVNYDGYLLGLDNLFKILNSGGKLYFSVPIGPQRIEFNAQRVFSVSYLLELFSGRYHIDQFSFVDDKGNLNENVSLTDHSINSNFGCQLGCGIFEMTKI